MSGRPCITFTVDGNPVPKGRPRVVNGHAYSPTKNVVYERQVGWAARMAMGQLEPFRGEVSVHMELYSSRTSGDIDNFCKAIFDGGNGILWWDDMQIVEVYVRLKRKVRQPRACVTVIPLDAKEAALLKRIEHGTPD